MLPHAPQLSASDVVLMQKSGIPSVGEPHSESSELVQAQAALTQSVEPCGWQTLAQLPQLLASLCSSTQSTSAPTPQLLRPGLH